VITPGPWHYREVPGGHYVSCETGVRPPNDVVICELKNTSGHDAEDNGKVIEAAGNAANAMDEDPVEVFEALPDLLEAMDTDVPASAAEIMREAAVRHPGKQGKDILYNLADKIESFLDEEG